MSFAKFLRALFHRTPLDDCLSRKLQVILAAKIDRFCLENKEETYSFEGWH